MRKFLFLLLSLFFFYNTMYSQELKGAVVVNAQSIGNANAQIFKTLEKQLTEFITDTKWTNQLYEPQEKIDCNMVIIINQFDSDRFEASIQVQSSRPVFGSSYSTPIYNINDKNFNFTYLEFQNIIFNPNQFESNLVSVIAFHVYMILGLDADSFELNGGEEHFKQAERIMNFSQQDGGKGWKLEDGLQSRFALIDNILSPTFKEYRDVMYSYHREGLDVMSDNVKQGKEQIATSVKKFQTMNSRRPNSFLLRTFFDAKADEIQQIFSGGPNVNIASLKEALQKVAPMHSSKWQNITF